VAIEPWFERAVSIEVPAAAGGEGRRGSGYMIAPGVILTALHVVIGPGRVPSGPPATCRISMLADLNVFKDRRDAERTAELKWPSAGAGEDDGDIAVLLVQGSLTDSMQECDPLPVLDDRIQMEVSGCGLPQFVKELRDTEQKEQGFWVFRGRVRDRPSAFDTLADLILEDQSKPDPEEWRGASGSALLHEESNALVGILVHADHTGYARISDAGRRHGMFGGRVVGSDSRRTWQSPTCVSGS
jgi:hypothetical protein